MTDRVTCPGCDKSLKRTTAQPEKYRKHGGGGCDFSATVIPTEEEECGPVTSETVSSAKSPPEDATARASPATGSTPSHPNGAGREPVDDASTSADASPVLPGVTSYVTTLNTLTEEQAAAWKTKVEAGLTPFSQPAPIDVDQPPLFSQPATVGDSAPPSETAQRAPSPATPSFSQPTGRRSEAPTLPMTAEAGEIAARVKELFYSYNNRKTADNRSAQTTLGPSEMGTLCDRRLALSLMRMPPVNPGGDNWASFVGTCIHAGLEEMFMWADAGTGRFAVEQRLEYGHPIVPKGTADLLDRTLMMVLDHKAQGRWSRNKLKSQGPIPTYRVQAHVYAHGMRLRGEAIEKVAIISWPRDESTLDDLYVWVEDYRPDIVKDAFERVERINAEAKVKYADVIDEYPDAEVLEIKARVSANFDVADDCRFCSFYLPNARSIKDGCSGKR